MLKYFVEVIIGRIYKHYKGDYYLVENFATHTESGERLVIYRALYGNGEVYARPYSMFVERINQNGQEYRFALQDIQTVVSR